MLNVIDHAQYAGAAALLTDANRTAAAAASSLFDAIAEAARSAGRGRGAGEWTDAYREAAEVVTGQLSHLVDAFGGCALLLDASGHNHSRAEAAAAPYGLPSYALPQRSLSSVTLTGLPPIYGGETSEPWGWVLLVSHLGFYQWPGADLDRVRALARAWHAAAERLRAAEYYPRQAAAQLELMSSPELPDAIGACGRLGNAALTLADDCDSLGRSCTAYAHRVLTERDRVAEEVEHFLLAAGITEVAGDALALVSGGLAELAGKAVEGTVIARYAGRIAAILGELDLGLQSMRPAVAGATDDAWLLAVADSKPVLAEIGADARGLTTELDGATDGAVRGAAADEDVIARGWAKRSRLARHVKDHAADVGAASEADYVRAAQDLLRRARSEGLPMKVAEDGDILVFDPASELFGVFRQDGRARTIFRPDPPADRYWSTQRGVLQ